MPSTHATLLTPMANHYLTLLCRHWWHRFPVEHDEGAGFIDFGDATCRFKADAGQLHIIVHAATEDDLGRLEQVVAEHLQRFAHKEGKLYFDWHRQNGAGA